MEQNKLNLEFKARQLFTPAAPISEANLFAGRTQQIRRLINAIAERGRHAVLFGERGVGKTSLTNTFNKLIDKGNQIVPIRKQASPNDTFSSLWRKIFRDMTFEITRDADYGKEETTTYNIADLYQNDILPDDVLRELRRMSSTKVFVIIFDEFDKLQDTATKELMAHTIKAISDSGIDSTVVIVGVADDITTLMDEHESVKRNLEEIRMPRMSAEELNEILAERLPKLNLTISSNVQSKITTLSRGLPEYVHLLGREAAISTINDNRTQISEQDVDIAINQMLLQSNQSSNDTYKKAIHSNKSNALYSHVLLACALARTDDEGRFQPTSLIEPLSKLLGHRVTIATFQSHLTAFCSEQRGTILEKKGSQRAYKYRFREPKMQPYVILIGISDNIIDKNALEVLSPLEQPYLSEEF